MSARRQRLTKVAEMWDEELRVSVGALLDARSRAEQKEREWAAARARTEEARASRAALMGGASADEWRAREAWIDTCASREERAAHARRAAEQIVSEASRAVTTAQQKVERMKLVLARLAEQEAAAERRADRRSEDEIAARVSQAQVGRAGRGSAEPGRAG